MDLAGSSVVVEHRRSHTEEAEVMVSHTAVVGTVAAEDTHCFHTEAPDCHTAVEVGLADCGSLDLGRTTFWEEYEGLRWISRVCM